MTYSNLNFCHTVKWDKCVFSMSVQCSGQYVRKTYLQGQFVIYHTERLVSCRMNATFTGTETVFKNVCIIAVQKSL